ncbi:MAG TPA: Hint domain-containing protein [Acetobacteraceae bacterium]|nr:Hint domain-containing protein [Acetobacteraceae bacterium]
MTFDTSWVDGLTFDAHHAATLGGITNNGDGTFTEDGTTYTGAYSDYWGTEPDANIASITLAAYNPTNAPGIITFQFAYQNGFTPPPFGAQVIAWDANAIVVEVLDGFVPNNQAAGTYVGTPDPGYLIWFSANDVSYGPNDNGGAGPTFPLTFGTTGAEPMLAPTLCFVAGTTILTPHGEARVETLRVGGCVTLAAGGTARIVWIGKGKVLATRGRRSAATPVILRKGSLGDNVPNRDLRVTKGHAFHIDGVLIPVEFLVNHRSILWDDRAQEVALYHIELEAHDVLLANGAPAESYRDDGNRWLFQNANSGWGEPAKPPCAAVLTGGPVVDAVWRRLLARAPARPRLPLTDDPDLHLLVDGRRVDASERHGLVHLFRLTARPNDVRIISRAAAPAELGLARDPRVLGVALRRIAVRRDTRFRVLEAADPLLAQGFHDFEQDNAFRWTDGDAVLPATLFEGFAGPVELMLRLGGTTRYMDDGIVSMAA